MNDFFKLQKERISGFISEYIYMFEEDRVVKSLSLFAVFEKILDFSLKGKMLRGSLVHFGASLFTDNVSKQETTACGAALEILQSSLLIHDDIMDNDTKRRGIDTVFFQYVKEAYNNKHEDPYNTGVSMGICSGDIAFFIAMEILNSLNVDSKIKTEIIHLVSREMTYVGMAQMMDVWWGTDGKDISEEDIINLYRFKTGRYTFSLPLMTGAILSGQKGEELKKLAIIGEYLGILFQIKDDELGIFGDEIKLGKPVGSDIKEGKKTLFYYYLINKAGREEKKLLNSIYGKKEIEEEHISIFRELIEKYSVRDDVEEKIGSIQEKLLEELKNFSTLKNDAKSEIKKLYQYNICRSK